jgi:hypothetical protein
MGLARPVIWLLVVVWLASFVCLVVAWLLVLLSGTTFEHRLYGIQFQYVAFALLACMAASSGLLWFNYRGVDFGGAGEIIYGVLFVLSAFGLLSGVLALIT